MFAFLKIMRTTTRPIRVKEAASVELAQDAAAMWSFMSDPASSIELNGFDSGVTLPGSPRGVGEIQVFIRRTPAGTEGIIHEVVEIEPGRRAVTRNLASAYPAYGALLIEPRGQGSCRLTQEFWVDLPSGVPAPWVRECREGMAHELRKLMTKLSGLEPQSPA